MEGNFADVRPSGVPETLWNYGLLKEEDLPLLPMMGLRVDLGFALAFGFGMLVIAYFAWHRFKERSFDPDSFDFRVLKELAPTELLGRSSMRRAYAYYAGTLLLIYVAMTFFGKLILEMARMLPIAGVQVDMSGLNFKSPEWPLLLAFGFAGFLPLLKPLEVAESWLRRRAHRAVGIPVKIKQQTIRLVAYLREPGTPDGVADARPWVHTHIGDTDSVDRVFQIREDLERFLRWMKGGRGLWPEIKVRDELQRLERKEAAEAETVLQEFEDVLGQDYDAPPPPRSGDRTGADAGALQTHHKRLEGRLSSTIVKMERLRDELASILAVYAQRDTDYSRIEDGRLQGLLRKAFPDHGAQNGPEFGILVFLVPVFLLYALFCALGEHPLLSKLDLEPVTVLATAALETTRIAVLFWVPAVVAFAWRFHLTDKEATDRDKWVAIRLRGLTGKMVRQMAVAIGAGLLASLVGILLLALLWAAVIAQNQTRFQEILFEGMSFLLFFTTQIGLVPFFLFFALLAADARPTARIGAMAWRVVFGLLAAAAVLAWAWGHLEYWYGGYACTDHGRFLLDIFAKPNCFSYYGGLDLVIYVTIAFLAALFGAADPEGATVVQGRSGGPRETPAGPAGAAPAALALAILLVGCASAAAETGGDPPDDATETIKVGFRADAEPFSYRIQIDGETRYIGYIADLCYKIFAGSRYRVVSVEVNTENRFKRIRQPKTDGHPSGTPAPTEVAEQDMIDVLCDPVTLRFSDPDERAAGIFSPIIFASGVSYMLRPTRDVGNDAYLGFVANSTAAVVAERICVADLLHVRKKGMEPDCEIDWEEVDTDDCYPSKSDQPSQPGQKYKFCVMGSHTELIRWFCDREDPLPYHLAYLGDYDLIQGKLRSWTAQGNPCPTDRIEQQQESYTYEPYALIVTKANAGLVQHVQRRIYEFFSHRSEARSLFTTYFPGQQMSPPLAYLFLLNAVAEEQVFIRPHAEEDVEAPATSAPAQGRPVAAAPALPPDAAVVVRSTD